MYISCRESDQNVLGFQTTKELLYGGLWQKEHSSSPSPSSSPTIKTHMFSITLLLDVTVARFSSLTHCMEAIKRVWPVEVEATPLDARASFIKHFYYEVYYIIMHRIRDIKLNSHNLDKLSTKCVNLQYGSLCLSLSLSLSSRNGVWLNFFHC